MKTYTLRLARDTSEYALIDVSATDDADAIAQARAILHDPDRFNGVFDEHSTGEVQWECGERIISLGDDDGRTLIEGEEREPDTLREAAPDLLAACSAMLEAFETGEHYETRNPYARPYVKAAIAAIAKATGTA